jgi:hypothetical protein
LRTDNGGSRGAAPLSAADAVPLSAPLVGLVGEFVSRTGSGVTSLERAS